MISISIRAARKVIVEVLIIIINTFFTVGIIYISSYKGIKQKQPIKSNYS